MKKTLLALIGLLGCAAPLQAQHVILDLDKGYPEDQFYFLTYNAESTLVLASNANGHDGRSAGATWQLRVGAGGLGYVGFGYLHGIAAPPNPFPDLTPYTHVSLWFNNVAPAAGAARVSFRFELHERTVETDPEGQRGSQVWIYESGDVLRAPAGWTELLLPLVVTDALGPAGFAIPPGGFRGNGALDLDQIRHWAVLFLVEGEPVGTVFSGTTLFDYLRAVARPVAAADSPAPLRTEFLPGRPNPFSSSATLAYTLAEPAEVSLRLYDVLGRVVAVPVEGRQLDAGRHETAVAGRNLAAGTYLVVLSVGGTPYTQVITRTR